MGMVEVGYIPNNRRNEFKSLLSVVPIVHGDLGWNCQNWVMGALKLLRENDFEIGDANHAISYQSLLSNLEDCKRNQLTS